jgi:hypothetical protein
MPTGGSPPVHTAFPYSSVKTEWDLAPTIE